MDKRWMPGIWVGLILGLGILAGCTQSMLDEQSPHVTAGGGDRPEVRVTAIDPTPAGALAELAISVEPVEGGNSVEISLNDNPAALDTLFLQIQYDPNLNHAGNLSADAKQLPGLLGLAVESEPGTIDFGAVVTAGVDTATQALPTGDSLISFRLTAGGEARTVSAAASGSRTQARNLELTQEEDGRWTLSWDYTNPGDNNQDGVVGVTDLTQIGQHFLTKLADSYRDPLRHIDSNHDGEINASDITAIGQNYSAEVYQYEVELFDEETGDYITVGTLRLGDLGAAAGQTARFSYTFGPQYVSNGWYRVRSLTQDLERGAPSEEVSESGRRLAATEVADGQQVTVTLQGVGLAYPIAHLNCARVVYPASFSYVVDSANAGAPGGGRDTPDGIWASFSPALLFPSEAFLKETTLADGRKALDLNVTTLVRDLPGAPVSHGDLVNFKLESAGSEPLTLEFMDTSADGIKRTYYTDDQLNQRFFGNTIGFSIQ